MVNEDSTVPTGGFDSSADVYARLTSIRQSIDNIDAALIHMLAERFKFTQTVGRLKAEHGLPPADLDREARQITRLRALAEESHLDPRSRRSSSTSSWRRSSTTTSASPPTPSSLTRQARRADSMEFPPG